MQVMTKEWQHWVQWNQLLVLWPNGVEYNFLKFKGYSIRVQGPVASNDWHVGGRTPVPRGTHAALLSQSFSGVNQLVEIEMRKKKIYMYICMI